MDINVELHMLIQVFLAFLLGGLIGWEREHRGREAGIRTFGAIAGGACLFGLISLHGLAALGLTTNIDPTRIASNVVVGVGFLGAGIIFREGNRIAGLTTAATLWSSSAVGLAIAFQMYALALFVTFILLLVLWLPRLSWWKWISNKKNWS